MQKWLTLAKKTYQEWSDDKCLQLGAALSFYTLGSLIPLLLVITSILTYVALFTGYGQNVSEDLINYVSANVSEDFGSALNDILSTRSQELASGSLISAVIGFVSLLFTASGVFGQLDSAFDVIWDVPDEEKPQGIMGTVKAKVFSFGLVVSVAFLLLVSTLLTTTLNAVLEAMNLGPDWLFGILNFFVTLAIISGVFMLLFRYLPSTRPEWGDVALGGLITAILWVIGQQILSIYFAQSSFSSYGIIGGVLAFLVYIYYSSQIVFFGGEFTQVYARTHGSRSAESMRDKEITPAGVVMVQAAAGAARRQGQRTLDARDEELAAAKTRQYAAAATGGIIGLVAGAAIGGVGLVTGLARGVSKLRRG